MTICHETPSGQRNTLILPRTAALNHLLQHPLDTVGPCETVKPTAEEIVSISEMTVDEGENTSKSVAKKPQKKTLPKKK